MARERGRGSRPISDAERTERKLQKEHEADQQKILEASTFASEVRTEDGRHLVHELEEALRNRVRVLMKDDLYCQGLQRVLDSINTKIDVGDKLIKEFYKSLDEISKE